MQSRKYGCSKIISNILRSASKKGDIVFDIGAHIGSFSVLAASRGAHVFAFEPDPNNFSTLVHNININKMERQITAVNAAIGVHTKMAHLLHDSQNSAGHEIVSSHSAHTAPVQMYSFTEAMRKLRVSHINLIKMDIEGAEYDILASMTQSDWKRIDAIVGEYHVKWENRLNNFRALARTLRPFFERIGRYGPYYFYAYAKRPQLSAKKEFLRTRTKPSEQFRKRR